MKIYCFLLGLTLVLSISSCKKDKTYNTNEERFQGAWTESSEKKISIVVSDPPSGETSLHGMVLLIGDTGYPFDYRFNSTGDSIYLSSAEGQNKPYKITFKDDNSFQIQKFYSAIPVDPATFTRKN